MISRANLMILAIEVKKRLRKTIITDVMSNWDLKWKLRIKTKVKHKNLVKYFIGRKPIFDVVRQLDLGRRQSRKSQDCIAFKTVAPRNELRRKYSNVSRLGRFGRSASI